ncbi:extracellular solute-binding protein [Tabrizicola sp.]|uniref:extracellular solute-binding protein n=1 Tax=Tabrizicola sp. TaxID=2005166 RepID=UPI001A61C07F|nr:extracellular solute-binding protein [Tabrizicola sp.]MBL9063122.1 extracellular solute-binding protein [Tabrizicola sp.]
MKKTSVLSTGVAFAALIATTGLVRADEVNVTSTGGAYQRSQEMGYGEAYEKLGHTINWNVYSGGLGEIRTQVDSGNVIWDIVDVNSAEANTGCAEGIFEKIDLAEVTEPAPDGTTLDDYQVQRTNDCSVGTVVYSWGFAFNNTVFTGDQPAKVADYFDTARFPGKRGIWSSPTQAIELALMADGVAPGDVYSYLEESGDVGVDRALAKLKSLHDDPNGGLVFWTGGAEPPELLAKGEVVMSTGWSGRFFNAVVTENAPITQVWDGQIMDFQNFAVIKGTPNLEAAKAFLKFATATDNIAETARYIPYAPWRKSAVDKILANEPWSEDGKTSVGPFLSTAPDNMANYLEMGVDYWQNHQDEVTERWTAWKAGL